MLDYVSHQHERVQEKLLLCPDCLSLSDLNRTYRHDQIDAEHASTVSDMSCILNAAVASLSASEMQASQQHVVWAAEGGGLEG